MGEADDGRPYLVMQLCPPPHLDDRIRRGGLTVAEVLEVGVLLAGAVETAHRLGILHRDITPANILYTEFGRPALTDFGIASSAAIETPMRAFSPAWAPPGQVASGAAPPQVDVHALAVTLWAMLTGRPPERPHEAGDTRPDPGREDVPTLLGDVLLAGLARDPDDRYPTALALGRALQQVQHQLGRPVTQIELWQGERGDTTVTMPDDVAPGDSVPLDERTASCNWRPPPPSRTGWASRQAPRPGSLPCGASTARRTRRRPPPDGPARGWRFRPSRSATR